MRYQCRTVCPVQRRQEVVNIERVRQLDDVVCLMCHGAPRTNVLLPSATEHGFFHRLAVLSAFCRDVCKTLSRGSDARNAPLSSPEVI
ncbi:hypothetical protein BURMUCF1_1201 [Burkholderia multivorans ATCC BAA-247]|nr:hypothetical protein BURMUCF1_1201 [Burkholderia multivorans ATCC BAA-247]